MRVLCFSSFTFSYLNRARVLFESLRRYHPDWHLVALITDRIPPNLKFDVNDEPFDEIVWHDQLGIEGIEGWLFKHDIVEVCTAVKGPFIAQAVRRNFDAVIYLDPDTCLFNSLAPVVDLLKEHDIILTPHLLEPETDPVAIGDNEISALWAGIYNLGFLAISSKGEGRRFADWWSNRLLEYCHDDPARGLFVDQKWCDHVPAFFDSVYILKDPGYNTASWNVNQRQIRVGMDGNVRSNDALLRFWHFTKLGATGDAMTRRYARDQIVVYELWRWYQNQIERTTSSSIPDRYWAFSKYENGQTIERSHRLLYRSRRDLQVKFPDPFNAQFAAWIDQEEQSKQ